MRVLIALMSESKATILVVHDGEELTGILARYLRHEGYNVIEAQGPGEAIAIGKSEVEFDVLLSQYDLPGLNGVELAVEMRTLRPKHPMVFMTGNLDAGQRLVANGFIWLRKPLLLAELTATLRTALAKSCSPRDRCRLGSGLIRQ
jgi:two-component system cell cycle sensor histidine kinase/response regulator CckA